MVSEEEWAWIEAHAEGDFDHLLLASSVPFLLGSGLHHLEAWNEAICDGVWGSWAARVGERFRRVAVLDHWASFQRSFRRLAELLEALATGRLGKAPKSVLLLSGDVHHSYLAEVGFPRGSGATSAVRQIVCSPFRKELSPREKQTMRFANSHLGTAIGRALARLAGCPPPRIAWRVVGDASYRNHVATLDISHSGVDLMVETTSGSDWRAPQLRTEFSERLC